MQPCISRIWQMSKLAMLKKAQRVHLFSVLFSVQMWAGFLNSTGLCPERVRSRTRDICLNSCFNTFCFYVCFSFQQLTCFGNPFSFFNYSAFRSVFLHRFWAQSSFFWKNLERCSNCCSNNCFLSERCASEAAPPGASWPVNRVLFESGGAPFFKLF